MSRIVCVGTALPPHSFSQEEVQKSALRHFKGQIQEIERLITVFQTVQVQKRFFCVPLKWFHSNHSFSEKNDEYNRWAERLSVEAIDRCLQEANLSPGEIDHLVFVSTSGMATPSVDARLINRMGFDTHVKRTPIFGLGCAGGAAAFSLCHQLAKSEPACRILLVCVELSSLTFQHTDYRKSNLIASALFSDGAAALLVCGDECEESGAKIVDTLSTLWPGTLDAMGWHFSENGLSVLLSRKIPVIIKEHIEKNVQNLLVPNCISTEQLSHFAIHPGGAKILLALENSLNLQAERLEASRFILRNYGNMSSPTVFFVLEYLLRERSPQAGEYGMCAAFGPGFSSELALLQW